MPVQTFSLAGNFSALVGEITRLRATIHANGEDDSWVNELDDEIKLGGALLATAADGTFTVTLPSSTGTGLQYEVRAEYVDASTQKRASWRSGWFDLTANANLADKANDSSLRVNPSLGAQLAARIDGYVDHGDVSGAVTFSGPTGSHWFDATGATTVTLDGFAEGQVATLICFSGADQVTVEDAGDVELADGTAWSAMLARGAWIGGGGGGEPAVPDTTPPTAVTGLTASGGEGQVTFNWNAATDPESAVKYGWKVYLTSGGETGDYTIRNGVGPVTVTGLAAGAYTVKVYSFSNGGSTTAVTTTATVTAALTVDFLDTFTRTNGQLASASTPDTGGAWSGSTAGPQISSGKLTSAGGETVYASRGSNPARELTADVTTTNSSTIVLSAWSPNGDMSGPRLAILTNGQISFQNVSNVSFNVTGGTNNFTPSGYLAAGVHPVKIVTNADGTCHAYIDDTLVISAEYNTGMTGRHVGVILTGTVDNIQVKS